MKSFKSFDPIDALPIDYLIKFETVNFIDFEDFLCILNPISSGPRQQFGNQD